MSVLYREGSSRWETRTPHTVEGRNPDSKIHSEMEFLSVYNERVTPEGAPTLDVTKNVYTVSKPTIKLSDNHLPSIWLQIYFSL